MSQLSANRLIVFVRAPREGAVKTRLAAEIGASAALVAYRELVQTVLHNIGSLFPVELRFTPDDALLEISPWLRPDWTARPQGDGDLGERLHRAFAEAFATGAQCVAIIGSDCPAVLASDIEEAWSAPDDAELVLGPASDGGYWLIAARAVHPELFRAIRWSSDQVLALTRVRAKDAGLRLHLLRELADVDTAADWAQHRRDNRGER